MGRLNLPAFITLIFFLAALVATEAQAKCSEHYGGTVKSVSIEGAHHVSPQSIQAALPITTGDRVKVTDLVTIEAAILDIGFFQSAKAVIKVKGRDCVLHVTVTEHPPISDLRKTYNIYVFLQILVHNEDNSELDPRVGDVMHHV